jgi:hypothetical protein
VKSSPEEIAVWESKSLEAWVKILRNPRAQHSERELAGEGITWLGRQTRVRTTLAEAGLVALELEADAVDGIVLILAPGGKTPYYLGGLRPLDIVVRVDVGTEIRLPKTAEDLEEAIGDLRELRRSGKWPGGVTVIRDGKQILVGSGRL